MRHLREQRHLAPSSLNQTVSALRRFYDLVLQRPTDQLERLLPRVRPQTRRPQVFSRAELERLAQIQGALQQLNLPAILVLEPAAA